ncbi:hypothetical protein NECID01_1465 [Nematocida sp. AWRm77]|nr:hypothetical protein NECID01_1465 [Nematocida sp. AWRm77]
MTTKTMHFSFGKLFACAVLIQACWETVASARVFEDFWTPHKDSNPHVRTAPEERYSLDYPDYSDYPEYSNYSNYSNYSTNPNRDGSYRRKEDSRDYPPILTDEEGSERHYQTDTPHHQDSFGWSKHVLDGEKHSPFPYLPHTISSPVGTLQNIKYETSIGIVKTSASQFKQIVGVGREYIPLKVIAKPLTAYRNSPFAFLVSDSSLREYFKMRSAPRLSRYISAIPGLAPAGDILKVAVPRPGFTGFFVVESHMSNHPNSFLLHTLDGSFVKAPEMDDSLKLVPIKECLSDIEACLFRWKASTSLYPV